MIKILPIILTALLVMGCSSNDDDDDNLVVNGADATSMGESADQITDENMEQSTDQNPDEADNSTNLAGDYSIIATPNADSEFDVNGGTCGIAEGVLNIDSNMQSITGDVLSSNGLVFEVEGTLSDTGEVEGGFAQGGQIFANFNGSFDGTVGGGNWSDNFGCMGTWEASKVIESEN